MSLHQSEAILNHLKTQGPLTPLEALSKFGCFRLGARIWDIKKMGFNIKTEMVKNNGKHYAKYSLEIIKIESNGQYSLI